MPENPFDFIWNPNEILDKLNQIDKEQEERDGAFKRSKSTLTGGRKARTSITESSLFENNLREFTSLSMKNTSFGSNQFIGAESSENSVYYNDESGINSRGLIKKRNKVKQDKIVFSNASRY